MATNTPPVYPGTDANENGPYREFCDTLPKLKAMGEALLEDFLPYPIPRNTDGDTYAPPNYDDGSCPSITIRMSRDILNGHISRIVDRRTNIGSGYLDIHADGVRSLPPHRNEDWFIRLEYAGTPHGSVLRDAYLMHQRRVDTLPTQVACISNNSLEGIYVALESLVPDDD